MVFGVTKILTYSKLWELVHLLGGKCVDCGNENFFDLEIDHINNDGDGERKYYTQLEKKYLQNPIRAKERLQIRCKQCHEKRHHPLIGESTPTKLKLIYDILLTLERKDKNPIKQQILVDEIVRILNISEVEVYCYISRLLREASIYEAKIGCYSTVESITYE